MLSLVNAPTLAADLLKRPGGAAAAEVLVGALRAGPAELGAVEQAVRAMPADRRAAAWRTTARATLASTGTPPVALALARLADELPGRPTASSVAALQQATFTQGGDLAALLTDDVLSWTRADGVQLWPDAVDALVDALAVALADPAVPPTLPVEAAARLTAPWRARPPASGSPALGSSVDALLAQAAALDPARAAAIAAAHQALPGWPLAMHRACWAAHLTGRLRTAAAAQFTLAAVLARRADRLELASGGAFAAFSGAVHAEAVADLLDEASRIRLLAPLTPDSPGPV